MPIPKPKKGEQQKEFMIRCISDPIMKKEYQNKQQRTAVCYTQWRDYGSR